mgnify:CR=1 FL=1
MAATPTGLWAMGGGGGGSSNAGSMVTQAGDDDPGDGPPKWVVLGSMELMKISGL